MENKSTKQLIAAANRKCEMRWKVLAFNPDEDNKLVKEFKDFDCIDCAVAKKREYLEKNPTHVVEVISESKAQRNEDKEFTIKLVTPFGKAKVCSWKAASVNDAVKEFLDANPAYRENKKGAVIAESAQRNEGNFKDDVTSLKDAQIKLDRAKDELKEAIAQKDFNRQQRFKSDIKYYEGLIKYIKANPVKESSQNNESYTIQNVKTRTDAEKTIKDKCKPKDFRFTDIGIAYDGKKSIAQYMPNSNQLVIFESAQKLTYNDIGIGDRYKLSNGKVLQVYDMGPDYIRVKINGQLQSVQSPEDFDSLKLTGVDMSETAQKNEASSLQALNKELATNVETLYSVAKHVRDRFKYRTLQNMSYDEAQAEKIYDQIEAVIEDAVKKLATINSKVIG